MSREYLLENALQQKQRKLLNGNGLAKIIKFDEKKGTVDIQPIEKRLVDGKYEPRPPILDVPISNTTGGGFTFSRQYKKGEILSFACADHDIDIGMNKADDYDPNTQRSHQGSDAFMIGHVNPFGNTASRLPPGTFGFGTTDGKDYLVVWPDGHIDIISTQPINVKSELEVNVEAGTTATVKAGVSATVTAPTIALTGNVTINGNLHVTGSITPWP
ncbi:hypothetical protein AGMMS49992_28640 [Clostridia bacterium]|nr:hypothetical protein AGMMS49992_28640 [Clostridia bacterium]